MEGRRWVDELYVLEEGRKWSYNGHHVGVVAPGPRKHPGQFDVREHDERGQYSGHCPHDE